MQGNNQMQLALERCATSMVANVTQVQVPAGLNCPNSTCQWPTWKAEELKEGQGNLTF